MQDRLRPVIENFTTGPLRQIIDSFRGFRDLFGSVLEGDIRGAADAFKLLPDQLWPAGQALWNIGSAIRNDALPAILNLRDTLLGISWDDILEGLASLPDLFTFENAQTLADNLATAFESVDWSGVRDTIQGGIAGALSGISIGGTDAGAMGAQIQTWITSEIEAVEDWEQVGRALKAGIISGIAVASGGAALAIGLIDWILTEVQKNEGDWKAVASEFVCRAGGDAGARSGRRGQHLESDRQRGLVEAQLGRRVGGHDIRAGRGDAYPADRDIRRYRPRSDRAGVRVRPDTRGAVR
jgi:hypothetical protein